MSLRQTITSPGILCALGVLLFSSCQTGGAPAGHTIVQEGSAPVKGAIEGVEIAGYCPVAYVEAGRPVRGVRQHAVTYEGRTYWFVDAGAKKAYEARPERYLVAFRGWSVVELASGERRAADPQVFALHEGIIYLFSSEATRARFLEAPESFVQRATQRWAEKQ